jgi:hypothetical protein
MVGIVHPFGQRCERFLALESNAVNDFFRKAFQPDAKPVNFEPERLILTAQAVRPGNLWVFERGL